MAYVNPKVRLRLDALSPDLRRAVLAQEVELNTLGDLIGVLETLVKDAES